MSKDSKDSFVFYRDWYYAATSCDEQTQLKIYRAIMEYVFLDVEPTDPTIQLAFGIIKQRLDNDLGKWEQIKEKRKEAGRRGAKKTNELRWGDKSQQMSAKSANADTCQQMSAKSAVNVNVDNDTNVSMLSKEFKPTDESVGMLQSYDSNPPQVRYKGLVEYWNKLVENKAMSKITDIKEGTTRRQLVSARIKEYGKDKFAECLRKAASSQFLNGENGKSFIASFDWIIRPNNFPKVLEGNYDSINNNEANRTNTAREQRLSAAASLVTRRMHEAGLD